MEALSIFVEAIKKTQNRATTEASKNTGSTMYHESVSMSVRSARIGVQSFFT